MKASRSPNFMGAFFMSVSTFGFVLNDMLMKLVFQHLSVFQAVLARGMIVVPLMAICAIMTGQLFVRLSSPDSRLIIVRTASEIAITFLFLFALAKLPLANVTAILQSVPLIITVCAALILKEQVGWRRWSSILVGFIGVMLIVRPGFEGFSVYSLYALAAAVLIAFRDLITRGLSAAVPSFYVGLITAITITISASVMVLQEGWVLPSKTEWIYLAFASTAVIAGYVLGIATMRIGEVSYVTAFRFSAILWAVLLTFIVTGLIPDKLTLAGIILIAGSGLYCLHRERVTARQIAAQQVSVAKLG